MMFIMKMLNFYDSSHMSSVYVNIQEGVSVLLQWLLKQNAQCLNFPYKELLTVRCYQGPTSCGRLASFVGRQGVHWYNIGQFSIH